ncbi:MAG: hypothetical protein OIF55_18105 [Amphritea sp.]|nr:hypothetical protein [Amphritea sp.]
MHGYREMGQRRPMRARQAEHGSLVYSTEQPAVCLHGPEPQASCELTTPPSIVRVHVLLLTKVATKRLSDVLDAPGHLFVQTRRHRDCPVPSRHQLNVVQQSLKQSLKVQQECLEGTP